MSSDPLKEQKDVEFYAAAVAAWLNTSLEYDKSIFTLSAGGIGLLITLQPSGGFDNTFLLGAFICAVLAFLLSLVSILAVFRRNRAFIDRVVNGNNAPDPVLTILDRAAIASFGVGAALTVVLGIASATTAYSAKERSMATESKPVPSLEPLNKSFNGLGGLQSPNTTGNAAPAPAPAPAPSPAPAPAADTSRQSGSASK